MRFITKLFFLCYDLIMNNFKPLRADQWNTVWDFYSTEALEANNPTRAMAFSVLKSKTDEFHRGQDPSLWLSELLSYIESRIDPNRPELTPATLGEFQAYCDAKVAVLAEFKKLGIHNEEEDTHE